jgi:CubicO group peptidase (beta-lactamase class C family)
MTPAPTMDARRRPTTWLAVALLGLAIGMVGFRWLSMLLPGWEELDTRPQTMAELASLVTQTIAFLGVYLRDIVAGPLDADVWIGLPEREASRVAPLIEPPPPPGVAPAAAEAIMRMVTLNGALAGSGADFPWNNRSVQSCEMPAVNGIATARGLARLFAASIGRVDGTRLLGPQMVDMARATASFGVDTVLGAETRFGLGFLLDCANFPLLGPSSFGAVGAGGSFVIADPGFGVALAYTPNRMGAGLFIDPRAERIIRAVRETLEDSRRSG